jgi:hypothetical protein
MKLNRWMIGSVLGAAAVATTVWAVTITSKTYRTTGVFWGVLQKPAATPPEFQYVTFIGSNLVNLAMGRAPTDNSHPDQVMALTFECDMSSASLVVYDRSVSNVVGTIANSTSLDTVEGVGLSVTGATNELRRFVAQLAIPAAGNATDGLAGGYFTVAGRVHINPATGCPEAVLVALDKTPYDRAYGDVDISSKLDADPGLALNAGLAHLIGVVDTVTSGNTNTVLVPYGELTIRSSRPVVVPDPS